MSGNKPKGAQRYRICGTPSRLGCLTCKIRRVKCGEEKPFCKRCTSTGRKCDGYGPPPTTGNSRKSSPPAKALTTGPTSDPKEQELLHFFTTCTVQNLSSNFWPAFWQYRVLQASSAEPSVLHAVVAIAAVHRDLNNRQNGQHDVTLQPFAFKQYTKAISHLHRLMSTSNQQLDITLISCILFICFDFLLGNHPSAVIHLNAGLKILSGLQTTPANPIHKWKKEFAPLLLTLGIEAASLVNPQLPQERSALWASLTTMALPSRSKFSSLEEARHRLDSLTAEIMSEHYSVSTLSVPSRVGTHLENLAAWWKALENYTATVHVNENRVRRGAALLKVYQLIVSLVICPPEIAEEKHAEILTICEQLILTSSSSTHAFSMTHDLICPLFLTAISTPDTMVQSRATELLRCSPGREGMWDQDDALRVLEGTVFREPMPVLEVGCVNGGEVEARVWRDLSMRLQERMMWDGEESPPGSDSIEFDLDMEMNFTVLDQGSQSLPPMSYPAWSSPG